ncbi:MAG: HlyD family secretion protein [Candidatus Aminicenantia bacterium]
MKWENISAFIILFLIFNISCSQSNVDYLRLSGTVEGKEIEISPKVPGQIKNLLVDEGDRVKAGDIVVKIDCSDFEIQKSQCEAMVESASSFLKLLEKGSRNEDIRLAEESMRQAQINYNSAERDFQRAKKLFEVKGITLKQFEDAKARYDFALAQLRQSEENLKKLKKGVREEEIDSARAKLKEAIAGLEMVEKKIRDCEIISPVDGFVSLKIREEGEFVGSGTPILKITSIDIVYLYVYISEKDLGLIKIDDKVDVKIDSFPDKKFSGKIVYISPEAEFTPRQIQTVEERTKLVYKIKIEIENKEGIFKVGMPADAYIKIK